MSPQTVLLRITLTWMIQSYQLISKPFPNFGKGDKFDKTLSNATSRKVLENDKFGEVVDLTIFQQRSRFFQKFVHLKSALRPLMKYLLWHLVPYENLMLTVVIFYHPGPRGLANQGLG